MALIGVSMTSDNMIASAVEYKVLDFMQMPGGPEAVAKELGEMTKRRFNTESPSLITSRGQPWSAGSSAHKREMAL